jgi:hypothetical protein
MSALMGEGPVKTLAGAQVGVNDATLPSFEDDAVHQA